MPHALIARAVKLQRLNAFLRIGIITTGAWASHISSLTTTWWPASANPVIVSGAASFKPVTGVGINQRTTPVTGNGTLACWDWKYAEIFDTRFNNTAPMANTSKIRKKRFQPVSSTATRFDDLLYFAKRCFSCSDWRILCCSDIRKRRNSISESRFRLRM